MRTSTDEYLWHLKLITALRGKIPREELREIIIKYQVYYKITPSIYSSENRNIVRPSLQEYYRISY